MIDRDPPDPAFADPCGALRRALDQATARLVATQRRLAALEAEHEGCDARLRELQEQNTNLVQLTVASQLLSSTNEHEDVLTTIEEIVVNMIGSEEIAIFEMGNDGRTLRLARARGIDAKSPVIARATAPILSAVSSGTTILGDGSKSPHATTIGLTAVVPLKLETSVMGVIAIFRLLAQKPALDPVDHELFEILSRQAALALYSCIFKSLRPTVRPPKGAVS
jgi:hypothetical protein